MLSLILPSLVKSAWPNSFGFLSLNQRFRLGLLLDFAWLVDYFCLESLQLYLYRYLYLSLKYVFVFALYLWIFSASINQLNLLHFTQRQADWRRHWLEKLYHCLNVMMIMIMIIIMIMMIMMIMMMMMRWVKSAGKVSHCLQQTL